MKNAVYHIIFSIVLKSSYIYANAHVSNYL